MGASRSTAGSVQSKDAHARRRFKYENGSVLPRDVFYLTVEETLGFIDGTAASKDLRALARIRKDEFARYREARPRPGMNSYRR